MTVEIKNSRLVISETLDDPAVLAVFAAASEAGRDLTDLHATLVHIGAQAATLSSNATGAEKIEASLARAKTVIEGVAETVERTVDEKIRAVTQEDGDLAKNIDGALVAFRAQLELLVAGENAPVRAAIMTSLEDSQRRIREDVSQQIMSQRNLFAELLDPKNATSPLRDILSRINEVGASVQAVRDAQMTSDVARRTLEAGVFGGLEYEEVAIASLQQIAALAGDDCEPTGSKVGNIPRSKVGDAVVDLKRGAAVYSRLVVECKNKALTKAEWEKECATALQNRAAAGFIGLCKHQADMPNGHRILVLAPDKIVLTFNPEEEATDLLIMVYQLVKMVAMSNTGRLDEVSIADVNAGVDEALRAITKFDALEGSITTIKNTAEKIRTQASEIRTSVESSLHRVQSAILRGSEPPALESPTLAQLEHESAEQSDDADLDGADLDAADK